MTLLEKLRVWGGYSREQLAAESELLPLAAIIAIEAGEREASREQLAHASELARHARVRAGKSLDVQPGEPEPKPMMAAPIQGNASLLPARFHPFKISW